MDEANVQARDPLPWHVLGPAIGLAFVGTTLIGRALVIDRGPDSFVGLLGGILIIALALAPFVRGMAFARHAVGRVLADAWLGRETLQRAFWLYFVSLGGLLGFFGTRVVADVAHAPTRIGGLSILFLVPPWLLYVSWSLIVVWRCAPNTRWKGWSVLARIAVALVLLMIFLPLASVVLIAI